MPFFWAMVTNVWIGFWKTVVLSSSGWLWRLSVVISSSWVPANNPFLPTWKGVRCKKWGSFLAEKEGIRLPSKVNSVFGKTSLPLPNKGPGIQVACSLQALKPSRGLPCNAEGLTQRFVTDLERLPSSAGGFRSGSVIALTGSCDVLLCFVVGFFIPSLCLCRPSPSFSRHTLMAGSYLPVWPSQQFLHHTEYGPEESCCSVALGFINHT